MVAGFVVPRFGQRGKAEHHHFLQRPHFQGAPVNDLLQIGIFIPEKVGHRLELELRLHPCQNNGRAHRLHDVIDGTEFQPFFLVGDVGLGRQENDRNLPGHRVTLQTTTNLVTIQVRHHDVQQDQVGRFCPLGNLQGLFAIIGDLHPIDILEDEAEQGQAFQRIIHHENGRLRKQQAIRVHHSWTPTRCKTASAASKSKPSIIFCKLPKSSASAVFRTS